MLIGITTGIIASFVGAGPEILIVPSLVYLNVVSEDELPTVKINKTLLSSLEKL